MLPDIKVFLNTNWNIRLFVVKICKTKNAIYECKREISEFTVTSLHPLHRDALGLHHATPDALIGHTYIIW